MVEVCLVDKCFCSYVNIYCKKFVYISCNADVKYFKAIDKILCNDFVLENFITCCLQMSSFLELMFGIIHLVCT